MKPSWGVCALTAACAASCGGGSPAGPPVAVESSAIQGGTTDTTHTFAVGIMQTSDIQSDTVTYCTGVLLAPNLVATARHCVTELSSTVIDCATSTFGAQYPPSDVLVTTDAVIDPQNLGDFVAASEIVVPSGTTVCGNDIALVILSGSISIPQYVEPTIDPGMTASEYEPVVTAIGYGVDSPTDTTGVTAGTRRIKENVDLQCIPDDTNPAETSLNCFADAQSDARTILTASEFMSGDSTCEGDSGSGAFEQKNFDDGKWVAFGVLSRGGTSADGGTCIQPIYSRFDAWGSFLKTTAIEAAAMGNYTAPAWATAVADADDGAVDAANGDSGEASGALGAACTAAADCASGQCASAPAGSGDVCVDLCGADGSCPDGFSCTAGYCYPAAASSPSSSGSSAGCTVAGAPRPEPVPRAALLLWGLALAGTVLGRRDRRRPGHMSASGHPAPRPPAASCRGGALARDLLDCKG